MPDVLIELDDNIIRMLRTKAEIKGRTIEEEIRSLLAAASSLTPEERVALSRKIRASIPPLENFDVRAVIRHGRDDEFD